VTSPPLRVYMDNNATTRVDPAAVAAMVEACFEDYGNPSSAHGWGAAAKRTVGRARAAVQRLVGAEQEGDIVFVSGGTEASNLAVAAAAQRKDGRDEIVTSAVEHTAVLSACAQLRQAKGTKVRVVPVDAQGRLLMDAYRAAVGPKTALVSIMWANNETGTVFPVGELAALAHEAGALFHTDAVQAVGKIAVDVRAAGVDLLSMSGHKLHGPKGIGALYVRRGTALASLIVGGRQERGRRAGTENVPGIAALGAAAAVATARGDEDVRRVEALRDVLEQGIIGRVEGVHLLGDRERRLPNTSCLAFEGIEGEAAVAHLSRAGVAISSGAACASGSMEPSHVVRAMRVPVAAMRGALRFSLSRENCDSDVDYVLQVLPAIVQALRETRAPADRSRASLEADIAGAFPTRGV
jgi:cysteine desulfurase